MKTPWHSVTIDTGLSQDEAVKKVKRVLKEQGYTVITDKLCKDGIREIVGVGPDRPKAKAV